MPSLYLTESRNDDDLAKQLGSMAIRCPITHTDVLFFGASDTGEPLRVGCERKKIGDMVNSIVGGRYLYQAQCAKESGIDILVLIVEGKLRPNPRDGLLETLSWGVDSRTFRRRLFYQPTKPAITYSRFDQYLTELDYLAGIIVKRAQSVQETANIIKALWDNFQTPPSKHQSLHQIYSAPTDKILLTRPGLVQRVAKELHGIGWARSRAVAGRFKNVRGMVNASADTWQEVEGIGKKTAESVVRELDGNVG